LRRTRSLCSPRFCRCLGGSSSRCEDRVEIAVLHDEGGGGLLPDPRDAGQVVAVVPPQGGVLGILPGRHPEVSLGDALLVVQDVVGHPPPVVEDLDVGILDQLEGVAVAGDDDHVDALGGPPGGQRGDDVVGLDALHAQLGHLHGLQHLPDEGHLGGEEAGGLLAPGLVFGVEVVAEGAGGGVEGDGQILGLLVRQQLQVNPNTALVTVPAFVARSVGRA
jgi:hypothetical protein